jgi:hypothetical protein
MKNRILKVCFFVASTVIISCSSNDKPAENQEAVVQDSASIENEKFTEFEFDKMMANFPKPLEMVNEVVKTGVKFDKASINPIENEEKYVTENKKAVNFGIYCVDLSYLSAYDKKQEILKSYKTVRKLAESLNALEAFDNVAGGEIDKKLSNKDTLLKIADDIYYDSYSHIKSKNKLEIAALIVCGSWIESQNIVLQALKNYDRNAKTEFLYNKTFEQTVHIQNLIAVLNQFKDNAEFQTLIANFEELKNEFAKNKTTEDLNKEDIQSLAKMVTDIRAKMIQ